MRNILAAAMAMFTAEGLMATARANVEPIQGSITYGGQPRTKLLRSPIGSTFTHTFLDPGGREVHEVYRINPDRTIRIENRHYRSQN